MTKFIDRNSFKVSLKAIKDFIDINSKNIKSWVTTQLEKVNAKKNWLENNPKSSEYIENRTHYKGEWSGEKLDDSYVLTKYKTITLDYGDFENKSYDFTGQERKIYNFEDLFLMTDDNSKCIKPCKLMINGVDFTEIALRPITYNLYELRLDSLYTVTFPYTIETYYYYSGKKLDNLYLNLENSDKKIKFGDVVLYTGEVVPYSEFKEKINTLSRPHKYIAIGMVIDPDKRTFLYTCYKPTSYGPLIELPDSELLNNTSGYLIKKLLEQDSELYTTYNSILTNFKNHKSTFYDTTNSEYIPDFDCFIPTLEDVKNLKIYTTGDGWSSYYNLFLNDLCSSYYQIKNSTELNQSIFYASQNGILNIFGRTCTKIPVLHDATGNVITCVDTYPLSGEALTKAKSDAASSWCSGCPPFYLMFGIY